MTMAYIIMVQPAVLSGVMFGKPTGMDFNAVMAATCLSAALATLIMALYARYPIAQAPGMGGGLAHREPGKGVHRARALLGARGIHAAFFGDLRSSHEVRNGPIARRTPRSFEA